MALKDIDKEALDDVEVLLSTIDQLFDDVVIDGNTEDIGKKADKRPTPDSLSDEGYSESQIEEILEGYEQGINPHVYMVKEFNWKQMREIRMGIIQGLDISKYCNRLYSAGQMKEIRLGLENGLDVDSYAKLIYSTTDMHNRRLKLSEQAYQDRPELFEKTIVDKDTGLTVVIGADCMYAYIIITDSSHIENYSKRQIINLLRLYGVTYGYVDSGITKVTMNQLKNVEILVAAGIKPTKGKDGYFELLFDDTSVRSPLELEDGRVDYTNVVVESLVYNGQILARYHHAVAGVPGRTVTDVAVDGINGEELKELKGHAIRYDAETESYIATDEGFVFYNEETSTLNVWRDYVINGDVNCYNGNINVDGRLHINGSVGDDTVITAKGDIIVEGFVAGAKLKSGQNIIIRSGVNANSKGFIVADGAVMGNFFENAIVAAKGNIESNYFLNCDIQTDGKVISKGNKSRIMGGNIKAAVGIESSYIGSYGASSVFIDVGNIAWINGRVAGCQEALYKVEEELSQLNIGKYKIEAKLSVDELNNSTIYQRILQAIQIKTEERKDLSYEIARLQRVANAAEKAYINVRIEMQQDSRVILGGKVRRFKGDVRHMRLTRNR